MGEPLHIEERGRTVLVRLARPGTRNALDGALMQALSETARALRDRSDIACVVLCGSSDHFSAGMDLNAARSLLDADATLLERRTLLRAGPDLCRAWEQIEAVTVVAIEGYCVGGAVALALACDFRIAGRGATMRLPEVPLGMPMTWHSLPRLTALVGPARAKRMTLFGHGVADERLLQWGLVDELVAAGGAEAEALGWAAQLEALPPLPLRMAKEAIDATAGALREATSFADRDQLLLALHSEDLREGMSAFLGKRPPRFEGR